ncbi:MAG: AmmeMemoRadiSam system radical SAM enzyme [Candidatus Marsarchaeota archaeon]|jgi:pyruvate formate lyase activating enzyme|nr:AmmeMemoRadiSam system radical SAM enzyme [Candidatus Marsarchaeota archaeon]
MLHDAILYNKLPGNKVECIACARRCRIPAGSHGFCFVRQNDNGRLKLATYGMVNAMQVDPIEKKPFNHFHPGTYVFGIGTSSCNWGCQFCQNHNISKEREITGEGMPPESVVKLAIRKKAQGIAFTYNEPAIFIEYALDIARLAHKNGLYTVFVTNGYLTKGAVLEMKGFIDAAVINFKGSGEEKFSNKFEAVQSCDPIFEAAREMRKSGIHIEFTDLIIPRVGESPEACDALTKRLHDELGPDVSIQFTAFHPDYKMLDYPETPYETLKRHYDIAKGNGLRYVYIGNIAGNPYESTYCPGCSGLVIERMGLYLTKWHLDKTNRCRSCGYLIPIIGTRAGRIRYREIESLY